MKVFLKFIFYLGTFAALLALSVNLFFQEEFEQLAEDYLKKAPESIQDSDRTLVIAYSFGPRNFNPTNFDPDTRSRLLNIYEALVKTNKDLQIEPSLALSWGRLSSTLWEFKLRPNVIFHDGSQFEADDVIASFDSAANYINSGLKDVLDTIESIEKVDELTLRVKTKNPDPLLVNRIGTVLIFPSELDDFNIPVGTGPYKFNDLEIQDLELTRNDEYWGERPFYKDVKIQTISNRFERLDALRDGQVQILANVPPQFAEELDEHDGINIKSLPSLEVNYLAFNFESELFQNKELRFAFSRAFDKEIFCCDFVSGFAKPSHQFVSNGIFGFNPDIKSFEHDPAEAKRLIREYEPFKKITLNIDMIEGSQSIAEFIFEQLDLVGISVNVNFHTFEELRDIIAKGESEMYYLGWRSELGDASEFFENAVFSKGSFNGGNYANPKVDELIIDATNNLDQEVRLDQLHEIMQIVVEEDIIGIPLFESDVVYGIRLGTKFEPRLDGYIFASEVN